jgi:hypothetical protein
MTRMRQQRPLSAKTVTQVWDAEKWRSDGKEVYPSQICQYRNSPTVFRTFRNRFQLKPGTPTTTNRLKPDSIYRNVGFCVTPKRRLDESEVLLPRNLATILTRLGKVLREVRWKMTQQLRRTGERSLWEAVMIATRGKYREFCQWKTTDDGIETTTATKLDFLRCLSCTLSAKYIFSQSDSSRLHNIPRHLILFCIHNKLHLTAFLSKIFLNHSFIMFCVGANKSAFSCWSIMKTFKYIRFR